MTPTRCGSCHHKHNNSLILLLKCVCTANKNNLASYYWLHFSTIIHIDANIQPIIYISQHRGDIYHASLLCGLHTKQATNNCTDTLSGLISEKMRNTHLHLWAWFGSRGERSRQGQRLSSSCSWVEGHRTTKPRNRRNGLQRKSRE